MRHQKSIVRQAQERLDSLMAIGESRYQAKRALREQGQGIWAVSTGKIHSYTTRTVYQQQVQTFVCWVRSNYRIKRLEDLDPRADELTSAYLQQQKEAGKSTFTLSTRRSALRLFFGNRHLAEQVELPPRRRERITRSRLPVGHDRHFQPANWQSLLAFLLATGLRRHEVRLVRVGDLLAEEPTVGGPAVFVANGKGGKARLVPVLSGREEEVLGLKAGRKDEERVFARIPKHLDVHASRRQYAQALYLQYAPGWTLPSPEGRLRPGSYDPEAVRRVSRALGHNRMDVVLRHYLR